MIQSQIQTEQKAPLLNESDTQLFISDMEEICETLDFINCEETIQKYPFQNFDNTEYEAFLERAKDEYNYWNNNIFFEIKIKTVNKFDSKCIACYFGKTVKGYRVVYLKMNDHKLPGRIIYEKHFALYFEVKDKELIDFGWCNKFLNTEEMKEWLH